MSSLGIVSAEHIPPESVHQELTRLLSELEKSVTEQLELRGELLLKLGKLLIEREKLTGDELRGWLFGSAEVD
jgi:ATP-dependent Zn protease